MILLSWWVIGHWFISCSLKILFLPISHIYSIPNETSKCIFVSSIWHFRHYFWCHLDFIQYSQWTQQIGSFNYILEIFLVIPTRNSICHDPLHPLHISGSMSREANIKMIKQKLTSRFSSFLCMDSLKLEQYSIKTFPCDFPILKNLLLVIKPLKPADTNIST